VLRLINAMDSRLVAFEGRVREQSLEWSNRQQSDRASLELLVERTRQDFSNEIHKRATKAELISLEQELKELSKAISQVSVSMSALGQKVEDIWQVTVERNE
jgi:hypothetical protein